MNNNTSNNGLDDKLVQLLKEAVPLIDSTADAFRFITITGAIILIWLFAWMFFIKTFTLTTTLITIAIISIPVILLLRFWWALEALKELPNIAEKISSEVGKEITSSFQGLKSSPAKGKANLFGQIKNLYQLKGLVGDLDDVFGQYLNIVTLLNPLSLIITILSLLAVFGLALIGVILVFI